MPEVGTETTCLGCLQHKPMSNSFSLLLAVASAALYSLQEMILFPLLAFPVFLPAQSRGARQHQHKNRIRVAGELS